MKGKIRDAQLTAHAIDLVGEGVQLFEQWRNLRGHLLVAIVAKQSPAAFCAILQRGDQQRAIFGFGFCAAQVELLKAVGFGDDMVFRSEQAGQKTFHPRGVAIIYRTERLARQSLLGADTHPFAECIDRIIRECHLLPFVA